MSPSRFSFEAELWEHDGPASWFFVTLPEPVAPNRVHLSAQVFLCFP